MRKPLVDARDLRTKTGFVFQLLGTIICIAGFMTIMPALIVGGAVMAYGGHKMDEKE